MVKTWVWSQGEQGSTPFANIYYVKYVYLYITLYMCVNVYDLIGLWMGR